MRWKFKEHRDEIITYIVKNSIWGIIGTFIPLFILSIKNVVIDVSKGTLSYFDIITIVLLILAIIFLSIEQKILQKTNNSVELFKQFHAKEMEAELFFENRESIISRISYKLTVSSPTPISKLHRSITWTGNKYNGTTLIDTNGNYVLNDSNRKASPYDFTIDFNEEKPNGSFIQFTTETRVSDDNHEMTPIYSFMVKYQIDKLILHVMAPLNLIENVRATVYADFARDIMVKQPIRINGKRTGNCIKYTFIFDSPTFLHNYFLEWEFTKK